MNTQRTESKICNKKILWSYNKLHKLGKEKGRKMSQIIRHIRTENGNIQRK